jgi:hypothetical protein
MFQLMTDFMLTRHKVRDFKSWKSGYDAHQPKRDNASNQFLAAGEEDWGMKAKRVSTPSTKVKRVEALVLREE